MNHLPKKFASCPNFYEIDETKRGSYDALPYEVRIFLHMNLSYELINHFTRNSCLWNFDGGKKYQGYDPCRY